MEKKSEAPVFFCIPDITGFTKFITSTKHPDFAHKVISNVLNNVISANILGLSVAEIEGDAVFFYKTGRLPAVNKVAKQCQLIYHTFLDTIAAFEQTDPELYHLYLSKNQLGIKIVIHHGHIMLTKIKGRTKLMGEDVILVHKLLKNSIIDPCYILLTNKYIEKLKDKKVVKTWFNWENVKKGKDKYEHFGLTHYSYISLIDCKSVKMNI
ncbi:DUF2652 domain-containing protein [Pedobacter alpinus]|uniref:DUF2652 domain-containing protein n=1 Tax=Pedobacter alpinus TaxID=1590643 RepID=A0ABW5TT97_9SPHI